MSYRTPPSLVLLIHLRASGGRAAQRNTGEENIALLAPTNRQQEVKEAANRGA